MRGETPATHILWFLVKSQHSDALYDRQELVWTPVGHSLHRGRVVTRKLACIRGVSDENCISFASLAPIVLKVSPNGQIKIQDGSMEANLRYLSQEICLCSFSDFTGELLPDMDVSHRSRDVRRQSMSTTLSGNGEGPDPRPFTFLNSFIVRN